MTIFKKGAAVGALLCTTVSGVSADELRFNNLFVIGDSLSDGGAYSQAVQAGGGGQLPAINYKFLTNAPDGSSLTYAEVLGNSLGLTVLPNVFSAVPLAGLPEVAVGGTNYSEGGSRVTDPAGIGNNAATGITTLPLTTQVDRLLADKPVLDANDLVILWGGANDVFAQANAVGTATISPTVAAGNMAQAAVELAAQVERIKAAGAETVIVVTVPDVGQTPFGQSLGAQGAALQTGLTDAFNTQLISAIAGNAVIVDSQKLLGAVQADPVRYGFTAPGAALVPACTGNSLSCIQGVNASADSELRVFADGVHPTTAGHALFGQAAFAGLQAATQAGAIPVATLTAIRQQGLSLEARLNPTVLSYTDENGQRLRREVGQFDVFAGFEFASYDSDAQQVTPGLEGSTQVARFGFDVPVTSNATLGLGLSVDRGDVTFDGGGGGFDSDLLIGAVFGQVALSERYYLNAALGGGTIDVTDITRSFDLGAARETYTAETEGSYRFARIGGGAIYPVSGQVTLNPFAHYTREKVSIDGYDETAGAASLSYGETKYEADRITLGLQAFFAPSNMPEWKFSLRGSIEHDLDDAPLSVSVGPNAATLGSVSAPRPDRTWGYLSGTVVRELGKGAFVNFSASASVSQSGTRGFVGSIGYKKTF